MLVLTRGEQDAVQVEVAGKRFTVTVVRIRPGEVRLGFDGPPDVKFLRTELLLTGDAHAPTRA